jgi:hypothetical protein
MFSTWRCFRTKRRAIVKCESWLVFGESELSLERIDFSPVPQHFLLYLGKVDAHIGRSQPRAEYSVAMDCGVLLAEFVVHGVFLRTPTVVAGCRRIGSGKVR